MGLESVEVCKTVVMISTYASARATSLRELTFSKKRAYIQQEEGDHGASRSVGIKALLMSYFWCHSQVSFGYWS